MSFTTLAPPGSTSTAWTALLDSLGWKGEVVSDIELLGQKLDVLLQIDGDKLARRLAAGLATPCLDLEALSWWQLNSSTSPSAGIYIHAIVIHRRRLTYAAIKSAAAWSRAFFTILAIDEDAQISTRLGLELAYYGVGAARVRENEVEILTHPGRPPIGTASKSARVRWLEESTLNQLMIRDSFK